MPLRSDSAMTSSLLNEAGYRRPGFKEWKAECFGKPILPRMQLFQLFDSWFHSEDGMGLGLGGNIVYLFDAPEDIDNDVSSISQWDTPRTKYNVSAVPTPDVESSFGLNYLKAFYHGLPLLTSWKNDSVTKRDSKSKSKQTEGPPAFEILIAQQIVFTSRNDQIFDGKHNINRDKSWSDHFINATKLSSWGPTSRPKKRAKTPNHQAATTRSILFTTYRISIPLLLVRFIWQIRIHIAIQCELQQFMWRSAEYKSLNPLKI
ncbi:hypothetical protein I7I51_02890 [Histoplasma capsulatum]|uniref:Uncharacterized protein n=1 Tax=Ajellomyces capsulatus TaxID=5037 RepID=A0A8A1MKP0_AJECA|nr:hypothetical protein I7I51_02890 [Histoplasma capsulatum]